MGETATVKIGLREYRKETLRRKKEDAVRAEILDYLTRQGIPRAKTDAAEGLTLNGNPLFSVTPGWPDITACGPGGKILGIECKRPIGDKGLDYDQAVCLESLWMRGGLILVARDVSEVEILFATGKVPQATLDEVRERLAKGITQADIRRKVRNQERRRTARKRARA